MKIEVEIPEKFIKSTLESAVNDYVHDHARRFIREALDEELNWSLHARVRLYDELKDLIAEHLEVKEDGESV